MSAPVRRRIEALEGPNDRPCLACELSVSSRVAQTDDAHRRCCHWPRKTLADELQELNDIQRTQT